MLKRILLIFFLCVSLCRGDAGLTGGMGAIPEVSSTCDTTQFEEFETSSGSVAVAQYATSKYRGAKFVYTGVNGKPICKIEMALSFTGSNSHSYYARLYSDDSGSPGTAIGTSDIQDLSSIGSAETIVSWTLSTPSSALSTGGTYHCVLFSTTNDADDYASWHTETNGVTEQLSFSADGSSWSLPASTATFKFRLKSQ